MALVLHTRTPQQHADMQPVAAPHQRAHLAVLHHGLWGSTRDVSFLEGHLREQGWLVHNARCNKERLTYDGVDVCGDRLAREVRSCCSKWLTRGILVDRISFIGYSMGGLIVRYAVGKLAATGFFAAVTPINLCTFATPHVGAWRQPGDTAAERLCNVILPWTLSRTGAQLVLGDAYLGGLPLLFVMAHPQYAFMQGLALFEKRILLANIWGDSTVPYFTAALCVDSPYTTHAPRPLNARYPSIVKPSTVFTLPLNAAPSMAHQQLVPRTGSSGGGSSGGGYSLATSSTHGQHPSPASLWDAVFGITPSPNVCGDSSGLQRQRSGGSSYNSYNAAGSSYSGYGSGSSPYQRDDATAAAAAIVEELGRLGGWGFLLLLPLFILLWVVMLLYLGSWGLHHYAALFNMKIDRSWPMHMAGCCLAAVSGANPNVGKSGPGSTAAGSSSATAAVSGFGSTDAGSSSATARVSSSGVAAGSGTATASGSGSATAHAVGCGAITGAGSATAPGSGPTTAPAAGRAAAARVGSAVSAGTGSATASAASAAPEATTSSSTAPIVTAIGSAPAADAASPAPAPPRAGHIAASPLSSVVSTVGVGAGTTAVGTPPRQRHSAAGCLSSPSHRSPFADYTNPDITHLANVSTSSTSTCPSRTSPPASHSSNMSVGTLGNTGLSGQSLAASHTQASQSPSSLPAGTDATPQTLQPDSISSPPAVQQQAVVASTASASSSSYFMQLARVNSAPIAAVTSVMSAVSTAFAGAFGGLSTSRSAPPMPMDDPQVTASLASAQQCSRRELQDEMLRVLDGLVWQKIDVDTRHYHAHAAIVVRSAARFQDQHAHIVEYAVRQLRL